MDGDEGWHDGEHRHAVLAAKLRPPRQRAGIIPRRALVDRMLASDAEPVVAVVAPPGYGKTTLAEATLAEATTKGALALVGRCYDLAETPPYGPWAEALAAQIINRRLEAHARGTSAFVGGAVDSSRSRNIANG